MAGARSRRGRLCAVVVLLCAAAPALGQPEVDCNSTLAQAAWLTQNTDIRTCVTPLIALQSDSNFSTANEENVKLVCTEACGEAFFDWLKSDECEGQAGAELVAFGLSDIICATSRDSGRAEESCLFSNSSGRVDGALVGSILQGCSSWFLGTQDECPTGCSAMLQNAVNRTGCCYNNFYGTEIAVEMITEDFVDSIRQTTPAVAENLAANFTVNITDSDLLEACEVDNPGRCRPAYTVEDGEPADSGEHRAGITMTASLAVIVASLSSALSVH